MRSQGTVRGTIRLTTFPLITNYTDNLPALTSNRDFVELIVTLPLPPSPSPFSLAHEEAIVQSLSSSVPTAAATCGPPNHGRRSFIVISVPVIHSGAPEDPSFVRAKYASVEAVWEGQLKAEEREQGAEPTVEWFMAVQSDSSGKVPLMFQEVSFQNLTVGKKERRSYQCGP